MDPFGSSQVFSFDQYRLDRRGGGLFRESEDGRFVHVSLGSRALDILTLLLDRCGDLLTKEEILAAVWPKTAIEESNLTVQIAALRRVLDRGRGSGSCIQTISGQGYRLAVPVARQPKGHASSEDGARSTPRMSLVVLPFANLSHSESEDYLADAITDDLTADLSRIPNSFVIARTTAFTYKGKAVDVRQIARELGVRYVLEGSVRPLGKRVHVNAQLLDGATGAHVWADYFDTEEAGFADAQREIVGRLARTIHTELVRDIGRRIEQEKPTDLDALNVAIRAQALRTQASPADVQARYALRDPLEQAINRDPGSVEARIQLASILVTDLAEALSTSIEQDGARAEQLINEALERDPDRSEAHRLIGQLRRVQGRWAESQVELETAIVLDPNNTSALRQLGITLLTQGKPEAAIPHFERVLRLDVRDRYMFNTHSNLGRCYLYLGRTEEAIDTLRRARTLAPGIWYVHTNLAGALGLVGELEEAKREIAEAIKLKPEVNSLARHRALAAARGFGHPRYRVLHEETIFVGLRRAGLPEE